MMWKMYVCVLGDFSDEENHVCLLGDLNAGPGHQGLIKFVRCCISVKGYIYSFTLS